MSMRQSLVRIWIGTYGPSDPVSCIGDFSRSSLRAQRFENAQAAIATLPPMQRLQVFDRIAWLNDSPIMPSSVDPINQRDPGSAAAEGN